MTARARKLVAVELDDASVVRRSPEVEHERRVAIYDILEDNDFALVEGGAGPYRLSLGVEENRVTFDVRDGADARLARFRLPLTPFRGVIRDYFTICESYYEAIRTATPSRIEAIDIGRRSLHDEGAELLRERLAARAEVDADTARRLFTLICVLHVKG
jgi:uncharacterized protein (UPF0262 family)